MPKRKDGPPIDPKADLGWKRDAGRFKRVKTDASDIGNNGGQAVTPERIAERLHMAATWCDLAEKWVSGEYPVDPKMPCGPGVGKAFLRDALVCLAECWLGRTPEEALALVREMIEVEKARLASMIPPAG